MPTEEEATVQF